MVYTKIQETTHMTEVTFTGAEETQAFFAQAPAALQKAIKKSLKQAATLIKQEAIWNCPVRTGYLRTTIFYSVNGDEMGFTVGAKAPYGGYVEFGTRYMQAQPYIRPAFITVMTSIRSAMSQEIENEVNKL
jgi:HK97 gp10 family phage protein